MKNSTIPFIGILLGFMLLSSCTREDEIVGWLPGTWRIEKYERTRINNDATVTTLLTENNVGYWNIYDDSQDDNDKIKYYEFSYNGSQGVQNQNGYVQISEEGNRWILLGGMCVGCDDAYNIEYFFADKFKLSKYAPDTSCSCTYKLTMEMIKE
jgi:hypothetical protein